MRTLREISFHLAFSKLAELHQISILNLSNCGKQQILGLNLPLKFINSKYFEKLHITTVISNNNVSLYQI